jgi:hypothetical protein
MKRIMRPEAEEFIKDYANEFGGVPPQTALTLERLITKQLGAPYRELLALVEAELQATKRSTAAVRSLTRLAQLLRARLVLEEVQIDNQ